jgi:tRNA dimethylallyltransferase
MMKNYNLQPTTPKPRTKSQELRAKDFSLLMIVGPTASGKSDLAMEIAKKFRGEIICADSRTVYRGMNIGTAKASVADQQEVTHWGLDLVEPGQRFTVAEFQRYAQKKIKEIQRRGNLPILVGGTGLYIDSVVFDFEFAGDMDSKMRQGLEDLSIEQLQAMIVDMNYEMPENNKNKRYLARVIEREGQIGDEVLRQRIELRAQKIFESGVFQETKALISKYGEVAVLATAGIVYKICLRLTNKEITEAEAVRSFANADWQYARRQRTWFKRNKHINWFENAEQAYDYLLDSLSAKRSDPE